MAIRYRKCPKCNSKNIIDIVYGYPPYDLFLLQEEGKIMLGGCCISDDDPNYYCKDCHNRYRRIDVIEREYDKIKGIKASVGGYWGGFYEVEIDFATRKLKWSHLGSGNKEYFEKTINKSTLDKFKERIVECDLLNWKREYADWDICDGTQWNMEIYRDGNTIRKFGSNVFPKQWDEFCSLMMSISGKTFN